MMKFLGWLIGLVITVVFVFFASMAGMLAAYNYIATSYSRSFVVELTPVNPVEALAKGMALPYRLTVNEQEFDLNQFKNGGKYTFIPPRWPILEAVEEITYGFLGKEQPNRGKPIQLVLAGSKN